MPKKITLHVLHNPEDGYYCLRRSDEMKWKDANEVPCDRPLDIQLLAQWLDDEAEGANYHEWVGVHESLGKLIAKHSSNEAAIAVLTEAVLKGGLRFIK